MDREVVTFQGKNYYRYPDAPRPAERRYFKHRGKLLHREIWVYHNGPIPQGYVIHHKDHNHLNNEPDNLVLMLSSAHHKYHGTVSPWPHSEEGQAHLEAIRDLTKAWHASPEGHEWHKQHGVEAFKKRAPIERVCKQCGTSYATLRYGEAAQFCSNNCKSAWRRDSGLDNVEKVCDYCGNTFIANKYAAAKCCSNQCASNKRWGK
jgi:hypothetical protein